jgi:hypothetical protein
VKKAVETQNRNLPVGTVFKKSTAVLASAKNSSGGVKDAVIPIKVGISEKGEGDFEEFDSETVESWSNGEVEEQVAVAGTVE